MIIIVKVKTLKKQNYIKYLGDNELEIGIKSAPIEGKANRELLKYLSKELGINKSAIFIKQGLTNPRKILELDISEEQWRRLLNNLKEQLKLC